uniref:Uncharacterized protein n=1 Tax=Anguilla anguilla TaxID=7936 RepID=A0A0E9PW93_ANGAN
MTGLLNFGIFGPGDSLGMLLLGSQKASQITLLSTCVVSFFFLKD